MQQLNEQTLKRVFWALAVVIFIYMLLSVPLYGITGDEITQWNYGKFVWNYVRTFGADKSIFSDEYINKKSLLYYGGFFDGFAAMLNSIFHPKDEFLMRHYWNMLFGFIGIVATGMLAKEFRGWLAAIVAVVFIFFTGRYFGESFNNPKDPPFAAAYVLAMWAIVIWLKNLENLKWKHTVLMGLAIGLAISMRIGGLLLVPYLIIFWGVTLWQKNRARQPGVPKTPAPVPAIQEEAKRPQAQKPMPIAPQTSAPGKPIALNKSILHLIVACAIGFVVTIMWWPYALENPISNPLESLKVMSTYPLFVKMLFEGHRISTEQVPWYYLPKWMGIGLPLYLLIGFIGGAALIAKITRKYNATYLWTVLFAALFPVFYILYKKSVLYDGLRHALFVVPPMIVIASLFFVYLFESFSGKGLKYAVAGVVLILVILPARFCLANHPNEYVYFNELVGGIKGAYGYYETDYYMNSMKQGYQWLLDNELKNRPAKDTALVATNCAEPFVQYANVSPVPFTAFYSRFYEKNQKNWDYAVYYGRFLDKDQLLNGYFPSTMAIHVITADGVPLCTILKNDPERNGYKGFTAMMQKDAVTAAASFSKAVAKYPEDMEVWRYLAEVYAQTNNMDAAQGAIDKAMAVSSLDVNTAFLAGQIALQRRDFRKAVEIFSSIVEENPEIEEAQKYLNAAENAMHGQAPSLGPGR